MFRKKWTLRILSICSIFMLSGCAAAPVALLPIAAPAVLAGASGGISYTFTNIAFKTTNHPMEQVAEASLKALRKMSIEVVSVKKKRHYVKISSRARGLAIYITVEYMTPALARLKVNAKRGLVLKDKGTAFEIVLLAERFLYKAEPVEPELASLR